MLMLDLVMSKLQRRGVAPPHIRRHSRGLEAGSDRSVSRGGRATAAVPSRQSHGGGAESAVALGPLKPRRRAEAEKPAVIEASAEAAEPPLRAQLRPHNQRLLLSSRRLESREAALDLFG